MRAARIRSSFDAAVTRVRPSSAYRPPPATMRVCTAERVRLQRDRERHAALVRELVQAIAPAVGPAELDERKSIQLREGHRRLRGERIACGTHEVGGGLDEIRCRRPSAWHCAGTGSRDRGCRSRATSRVAPPGLRARSTAPADIAPARGGTAWSRADVRLTATCRAARGRSACPPWCGCRWRAAPCPRAMHAPWARRARRARSARRHGRCAGRGVLRTGARARRSAGSRAAGSSRTPPRPCSGCRARWHRRRASSLRSPSAQAYHIKYI